MAFSTNGVDTFTAPQTITNGTLLTANTPYMQYNEYFNRWVSTATPITNSASFNVNYSPPLLSLASIAASTITWSGGNIFNSYVTASSATISNLSVSTLTIYGSINTQGKHWELISTVNVGSSVSSVTVGGLNGNVDEIYKIEGYLYSLSGGNGIMYFNQDRGATNYTHTRAYSNGTQEVQDRAASNAFPLYYCDAVTGGGTFTTTIYAKAINPYYRHIFYEAADETAGFYQKGSGIWGDTTSNIISITFYDAANITYGWIKVWALR